MKRVSFCVTMVLLLAPGVGRAQANEGAIRKQLQGLETYKGMPGMMGGSPNGMADEAKPAAILSLSKDIAGLPAGPKKVALADQLAVDSTRGQTGAEAVQAAADTLAAALKETPQAAAKDGSPAHGYMELARIARYGGVKTSLTDPQLDAAAKLVLANEADAAKADFTLKNLDNKKVTLSEQKGKIVLLQFFSSDCAACLREMQDLELINQHYAKQGLVIVSISQENPAQLFRFMSHMHNTLQVVTDDGGKVFKAFHVEEVPRTFVFDAQGKLVGESLNMLNQREIFDMLGRAGLKPE